MRMKWDVLGTASGLASTLVLAISLAQAAEIKVVASRAVKESVNDITSRFEKTTGHKVVMTWDGTEAITKRISGGEVFDVVIIAAPNMDKLIQEGKLVRGSRTDFAKSGIGVAIRTGLPRPDISTADAVKQAVLKANSVVYSSGPSGFYLADLFKRFGIADQIKDKVKQPASGVQIADLLARGEADLGFQQISELIHAKGIDYLGPLPTEIQKETVWSAGLHSTASAPDAAKTFMKLLRAPESASIIKKSGMDPV